MPKAADGCSARQPRQAPCPPSPAVHVTEADGRERGTWCEHTALSYGSLEASSDIAAFPDSVNSLEGVCGDVRTPDKLIDQVNDTSDGRHMWLAPILPGLVGSQRPSAGGGQGSLVPHVKSVFLPGHMTLE